MKRPIRIRISKLGRQKALGLAYKNERVVYLDPRLKGFQVLDTAIHEILHCQQPDLSEETVNDNATEMADLLWKLGFRLVDNYRK